MRLLDEILSDYPRVWNYYKHDTGDKARTPKFAQRYPLPLATLSMMLDFHKWTHKTAYLYAGALQQDLPTPPQRTETGPSPIVMVRLRWMSNNWNELNRKNKSLCKTLGDEVLYWHTRIRVKVNDGDLYSYDPIMKCTSCGNSTVVQMNDMAVCVNVACRNPMTGEWRSWQIA